MARLVDVIEAMIKQMLEENNGSATISRSVLAEQANCVPSQVTYVLSTRFSTGNGYIVESRRGGGGQITITQIKHTSSEDCIRSLIQETGDSLSQQEAKTLLINAVEVKAIDMRQATSIMSAVSDRALAKVDTDIRSQVRADVFRNALAGLLIK
jgi:transcriptional regulator CtsR